MKQNKGFTIIELVVVMAVFLFVVGATIGVFLSIVANQKKVLSEEQLLNQIGYAEEYMSKGLRMAKTAEDSNCITPGYIYQLTRHDSTGFWKGIKFINQSDGDACQEFYLDNITDPANPVLKSLRNGNGIDDTGATALTSTDIQIKYIKFAINGSSDKCSGAVPCGASYTDSVQPRLTVLIGPMIPGDKQVRTIQTTVSRRNLNVNNGQRQ